MKILKINKLDKYNYELKSENKVYNLNIEFYGISNTDEIEYIYMHEENLKNNLLSFGLLDDKSGKVIKSEDDKDLVMLVMKDGKKEVLKRLYG